MKIRKKTECEGAGQPEAAQTDLFATTEDVPF